MSVPAVPARSAGISGALAVVAVALTAAFVAAPRVLASIGPGGGFAGRRDLVGALRESFVGYWSSGDRDLSPGLARVVEYWFRYHLAKGAIAAILLIVLVVLGVRIWRVYVEVGGMGAAKRAALVSVGVVVTGLALFSLVVVVANVQGAVAPLASLLPMLTAGATGAKLTGTLDQIQRYLAASPGAGGRTPPALEVIISDYARYHVVMAVITGILAAVFIGVSVVLWKSFARTESSGRRTRRLLGSFGVASPLLALAMIIVAVANTTTAVHPVPPLLAFFHGSW